MEEEEKMHILTFTNPTRSIGPQAKVSWDERIPTPRSAPLPYPPSLCFNHAPMGCPGNRKKVLGQAGLMNDISWPFHVCMSFSLVLSFSAVFFCWLPKPPVVGFFGRGGYGHGVGFVSAGGVFSLSFFWGWVHVRTCELVRFWTSIGEKGGGCLAGTMWPKWWEKCRLGRG